MALVDDRPVALWPVEDGDCVCAELEGLAVCADPEDELERVDVEEDGVVDVESC